MFISDILENRENFVKKILKVEAGTDNFRILEYIGENYLLAPEKTLCSPSGWKEFLLNKPPHWWKDVLGIEDSYEKIQEYLKNLPREAYVKFIITTEKIFEETVREYVKELNLDERTLTLVSKNVKTGGYSLILCDLMINFKDKDVYHGAEFTYLLYSDFWDRDAVEDILLEYIEREFLPIFENKESELC